MKKRLVAAATILMVTATSAGLAYAAQGTNGGLTIKSATLITGKVITQVSVPPSSTSTTSSTTSSTTKAPTPPSGAKPNASNTGVPAGTSLSVVNGDQTYSTNGQVITGLDVHGKVTIKGNNITLKNSIVRGPQGGGCTNAAAIDIQGTGITVQDTEVAISKPTACIDGIWAKDATLLRLNIHGSVDGVKTESNVTIQDSFIHDMSYFKSDPNQGGGDTHNDGVQAWADSSNLTLKHNTIQMNTTTDNSALQTSASNMHIDSNWLTGGGCTINIAAQATKAKSLSNIWITNNRFGGSSYNCPILISNKTTLTQNSGNVWDADGKAIPAPQQHD